MVNNSAAVAAVQRTAAESTTRVTHAGSSCPEWAGSKRGFLHASATMAKVAVRAQAAPIRANDSGTGRSVEPPTPCASTVTLWRTVMAGLRSSKPCDQDRGVLHLPGREHRR